MGREGESDLYYTSFAVRCLAMLDGLESENCESIANYLKQQTIEKLHVVDLISFLYSALAVQAAGAEDLFADANPDWSTRILETLESVRTNDGGYAKSSEGAAGSTYQSFLITLTYQLLGQVVPRSNSLIQFVYDRQRDDGGFVEIAPMKRSGTNPTAAAVAILKIFNAVDAELKQDIRDFLNDVWSGEGGFQANTRIPFADGLSTFTGLLTAQDLGIADTFDPLKIDRFIREWLEFPTGGFRGASWDEQADVEYTFYGLGVYGLLWSAMDA